MWLTFDDWYFGELQTQISHLLFSPSGYLLVAELIQLKSMMDV